MAEIKYTSNSLTQEVIKRTIQEYAPESVSNKGGYTYINGSLMPKALSRILARSIRAGRIVRPGVGMTEEFIGALDPATIMSVTVQLQKNIGIHTRTLRDGGKAGTPYNDGLINTNRKIIPATTPLEIPVRQIDDQPLFFPRLMLETMLFDEVAETMGNFFDNEINSIDSYHLAKMVAYAVYRNNTDQNANNFVEVDRDNAYNDLEMIKMISQVEYMLANGAVDSYSGINMAKGHYIDLDKIRNGRQVSLTVEQKSNAILPGYGHCLRYACALPHIASKFYRVGY